MAGTEGPGGSGLARERTVLAWNRSGLAAVVCIAVLLRHLWPLEGVGGYVALAVIAAAAIVWAVSLLAITSSSANRPDEALFGERVFRLMTVGTVMLASWLLAFVRFCTCCKRAKNNCKSKRRSANHKSQVSGQVFCDL